MADRTTLPRCGEIALVVRLVWSAVPAVAVVSFSGLLSSKCSLTCYLPQCPSYADREEIGPSRMGKRLKFDKVPFRSVGCQMQSARAMPIAAWPTSIISQRRRMPSKSESRIAIHTLHMLASPTRLTPTPRPLTPPTADPRCAVTTNG